MKLIKKLVDWFEDMLWRQSIKEVFENPEYYLYIEDKDGEKMTDFIKKIRKIKKICTAHQYCQDFKKGNCQFYDKNSGYCIFGDTPELWEISENIENQINKAFEKDGETNG